MSEVNPREIVYRLLRRWEEGRDAADDLLHGALGGSSLPARDRALATEMFYGCLRQRAALDWLASQKARSGPLKPGVASLVRLGLYQLFFLDKVPAHAAVNETVKLAKRHLSPPVAGFINAILRAADRERPALAAALKRQPLAVSGSHPEWLVKRWLARHGEADARALVEWNNQPPRLWARVNTLRASPEGLLAKWRKAGVEAEPASGPWQGAMIALKAAAAPEQLPGFAEGEFYIQDPSTLLAVELLDPRPGERVLDACAAPGGKTTCIAARMQDRGEIVAEDSSADRLKLVTANCARLGVRSVVIRLAREPDAGETWFDRVLVDVPCSNTGVMRRRVDLRWRLRPDEPRKLAAQQLRLLGAAARRVKRGGVLVYSTCSLEPEENSGVVEAFLGGNAEFTAERTVETFPPRDAMDGAYAARLTRRAG